VVLVVLVVLVVQAAGAARAAAADHVAAEAAVVVLAAVAAAVPVAADAGLMPAEPVSAKPVRHAGCVGSSSGADIRRRFGASRDPWVAGGPRLAKEMAMDLTFKGIPQPIRLIDSGHLVPLMRKIVMSWPFVVGESDPATQPIIVVRGKVSGSYWIEAPWLDEPIVEETDVCTVCSLIIDLVRAWFDAHPAVLCMHCGAVEFAGRLVVFPSTNRSGKSTLIARLAAEGVAVHADDLLPLTQDDEGMSLGISPRLRLPLPENAGVTLTRFVMENQGAADQRYKYLELAAPLLAPFGKRSPIGAFVLLERQMRTAAELLPAPRGFGLQHIVRQNFVRQGSAVAMFARLRALIEVRPCYRLIYSDLDEAVDILKTSFAAPASVAFAPSVAAASVVSKPTDVGGATGTALRPAMDRTSYCRNPDALVEILDGESFLVLGDQDAIFYLNPIAGAIWRMLAEPLSEAQAAMLVSAAFPDLDRQGVRRDIRILFKEMSARKLILSAPHEPPAKTTQL
jgi:hypothetical protein